jgi:mono/diheme cytochrome c family protein
MHGLRRELFLSPIIILTNESNVSEFFMKFVTSFFSLGTVMVLMGVDARAAVNAEELFSKPKASAAGSVTASSRQSWGGTQSLSGGSLSKPSIEGAGLLLAIKSEQGTRLAGSESSESQNPTYLRDVRPIFIGKCFRCHNDQTRFLNNWANYNEALADRWEIKRRVWDSWKGGYFKQPMPTANSPESEAITEEERILIKKWVDAGALRGVQLAQSNPHSKAERVELGRTLFTTICAACHQPSGQGIPNRFPPLAGSDFLNTNKQRAIGVVLHGLQGEVVVNGLKFNNSMPLLPLDDGQIAAALTYVYNSFGNSAQDVTPEEVRALRNQSDWTNPAPGQHNVASTPTEKSPWE